MAKSPWPSSVSSKTRLGVSSKDESSSKVEENEEFRRRMAIVRSLQMAYYKPSPANSGKDDESILVSRGSSLNEATGELLNLPLFRAPWWEVPGRSNVLNIHEPIYTNMFEKILYGPKPWCFGHLYLKDGSRNLKTDNPRLQLETWQTSPKDAESAVLGCLMNISDYRRLADGRLLLLVHAMERFVVTKVQQKLPYSIVEAQILPDAEEIDPAVDFGLDFSELDLAVPRALAVQESVRYHAYEYDRDHVLPLQDRPDMTVSDIAGRDIARVLPYCPFSKTLEPPIPNYNQELPTPPSKQQVSTENGDPLPSLEYRLLCQGVYQTPLADPEYPQRHDLSADELEYELWLAINNFLIQSRTPVSPVLLGLLPLHLDIWPDTVPVMSKATATTETGQNSTMTSSSSSSSMTAKPFALKQIVSDLAALDSMDHDFVQVSRDYPPHRRQRRLSYSAAHLLESTSDVANALRPKLLAIPSTRQRLRMVLEQFDLWQEAKWGEFQ
jgi:Lon protease-like protein